MRRDPRCVNHGRYFDVECGDIDPPGLKWDGIGEELIIDVAHYKQVPRCQALVCFVYDPEHRLRNPRGIENDLSKVADGLEVRVLVRPK